VTTNSSMFNKLVCLLLSTISTVVYCSQAKVESNECSQKWGDSNVRLELLTVTNTLAYHTGPNVIKFLKEFL
jgi:hypothetical protein